ncbi:MAG: preprotein translocase subunit SecA, partial [Adlercreutzia sp.]
GEVKIVDEFTGRIMEGRRYSEGLHQALEAKERVLVREENQTLATITLQNYFRLYDKLSGMTGTAMTEDAEFRQIYKLPVMAIPPNRPVIRVDENDLVYRTIDGKFNAVADDIAARHAKGQPCLIGTVSIENSEKLSRLLDKRGIKHETLNAKHHEREAHIVAQAGRLGAVTIATNMAGRGTDIRLGGEPDMLAEDLLRERGFDVDAQEGDEEARGPIPSAADRADALTRAREICDAEQEQVLAAGGLCVIGTERHESRRIDNQLRGRSGRQGDPGVTQFYLSLEDDLMRLFGGSKMDSIAHMMEKTNQEDDMPIQAGMVSKSIESAQRQVESMHFAARKNVLEYDDVMNLQRKAIYEERNAILDGKSMTERIPGIIRDAVDAIVGECCPGNSASDDWDVRAIDLWAANMTGCNDFSVAKVDHEDEAENVAEALNDFLTWIYEQKSEQLGHDLMENLSAQVMLRIIDTRWMAHLQEMDYLKTGIGLRAFGQRDPLVEYKNEAYNAFQNLTSSMYDDYLRTLLRLEIAAKPAPEGAPAGAGRPAPAALAEQEDPLARKMSYSAPEQALEESSIRGRHAAAARAASGVPAAPTRPAAGKPQTSSGQEDPYANVGRNDPCPCGSGKFKSAARTFDAHSTMVERAGCGVPLQASSADGIEGGKRGGVVALTPSIPARTV